MTVRQIVDRFGGQSALARDIGKRASTVAYWIKANTIPSKWHQPLLDLARDHGIDLTSTDLIGRPNAPVPVEPKLPVGMYPGTLTLGEGELKCFVLDDGRRVITRVGAVRFLSGKSGSGGDLEGYVGTKNLAPYMPSDWKDERIEFTIPGLTHKKAHGITAETFLDICRGYLLAREDEALTSRQQEIARQAAAFIFACSKVGLIALIDEATGFQYEREQDALQFKLKLFLADEMRQWEKTFPDELWKEFGRLTGWDGPISSRPKYWGKLVLELVYEYLDPDVADWLKNNAPKPRHGQNYHQWLNDQYGLKKLTEHIWLLVGIASTCHSIWDLKRQMGYRFGKVPIQLTIWTDPPRQPSPN